MKDIVIQISGGAKPPYYVLLLNGGWRMAEPKLGMVITIAIPRLGMVIVVRPYVF